MNTNVCRIFCPSCVPFHAYLSSFVSGDYWNVPDALFGVGNDAFQQGHKMTYHPGSSFTIKELRTVLETASNIGGALLKFKAQVEHRNFCIYFRFQRCHCPATNPFGNWWFEREQ